MKAIAHAILFVIGTVVGFLVTIMPGEYSSIGVVLLGWFVGLSDMRLRRLLAFSFWIFFGGFLVLSLVSIGFSGGIGPVFIVDNLRMIITPPFFFLLGVALGNLILVLKKELYDNSKNFKKKIGNESDLIAK